MSATNSGVTPESGISYFNQFLFYSRDQAKGPSGEVLGTGQNSVMMDMNSLVWVSKRKIEFIGGALFFHVSHNSDRQQLPHVGYCGRNQRWWRTGRFLLSAVHSRMVHKAGRYSGCLRIPCALGNSVWVQATMLAPDIGRMHLVKLYVTGNRRTAISAFQMYEIHTTRQGTQIHPGETLNLDYSVTHVLPLKRELNLQVGLVGYEQWQLTDKTGPDVTAVQSSAHYRINAPWFRIKFGVAGAKGERRR